METTGSAAAVAAFFLFNDLGMTKFVSGMAGIGAEPGEKLVGELVEENMGDEDVEDMDLRGGVRRES